MDQIHVAAYVAIALGVIAIIISTYLQTVDFLKYPYDALPEVAQWMFNKDPTDATAQSKFEKWYTKTKLILFVAGIAAIAGALALLYFMGGPKFPMPALKASFHAPYFE